MNHFLEKSWLNTHLKQVKTRAGQRYTPKLNVDLPISEIFDGICRTEGFYISIRSHFGKLEREFLGISSEYQNPKIQKAYISFSKKIFSLLEILKTIKEYDTKIIAWKSVGSLTKIADELAWKLIEELQKEKEKDENGKNLSQSENNNRLFEKLSFDIHNLYSVQNELRHFKNLSSSSVARLSNKPALLLNGLAGSGKTHLLCDVLDGRIDGSFPTVLLFGEFFLKGKVWQQIATQLGLNSQYGKEKVLKELNEAGKLAGVRSLLIIDALNESKPISFWSRRLNALCREVGRYPHIALAVSIRSGFEKEVLNKTTEKLFVSEEHRGFQFREWEAVTKFFNEFSIPLPEIPLLMPEFQNPLFLLLFCKAFQGRAKKNKSKKKKQIFRGHEGATYIFETYVDKISKTIEDDFGISHGSNRNVWDTVIERVAEQMVEQDSDRISEKVLINIIQSAHHGVNHNDLIRAFEKNFLLIKVPRYSLETNQITDFDYRFPFQKFSDHLIGRYIFKKFKSSRRTPKQFFGKNTRLGKFIKMGWNRGIIEALSIQCPEWLKGVEFFEVAPYIDNWIAVETFTESLIWRRPDAFSKDLKNVLGFINKYVITNDEWHNNLLNAFLSIAAVPGHPLNARFLHKHLAKFSMPKRDSWWSTFLHYQWGEHGAVDRLIEWGWSSQEKTHISDASIRLYSTALAWFLSSPDRFLRDKTTKALVTLLTDRLNIITELLEQFKTVNDVYILERLYAVAYGCSLRNSCSVELKKLAGWFLSNVFKDGKVPTHILMRDYARGVIEVAIKSGKISDTVRLRIIPPYGSKWPYRIPTKETLRKKYYPDDFFDHKTKERGFLDVWSSVMYDLGSMGDFGKYDVNPALGYWSGRKLDGGEIHRKSLFEKFKKGLTKKQLKVLNQMNAFYGIDFKKLRAICASPKLGEKQKKIDEVETKKQEQEEEKDRKMIIKQFNGILSEKKRKHFKEEIKPYLDCRGGINDPLDRFDTGVGQRWIFNRVVELGWSQKLHGRFDSHINSHRNGRSGHKPERIGKKYQWIALHELLALVADNFEFISERWNSPKTSIYEGSWQICIRDIDPSCTLKELQNEEIDELPIINRYKPSYDVCGKSKSLKTWLMEAKELPNPASMIEIIDEDGGVWVVLEGYCEWQEETPPEYEKYNLPTKTLYFMVKSYLVKKENKGKVLTWSKKQKFYGRWMPESHEFHHVYLGEYPSCPAFLYNYVPYYHHNGWTDNGDRTKIPTKILVTDDEYLSSGSSIDCSTEEALSVKLPAKWIVDKMGLEQKYTDGRFFDKGGDLVVFDPTIFIKNVPAFLLMRKDKLCKFLHREKCEIFWTLLGEKQTIGGDGIGQPYGWQEISGSYAFNKKNKLVGSIVSEFKRPTPQVKQKRTKKYIKK